MREKFSTCLVRLVRLVDFVHLVIVLYENCTSHIEFLAISCNFKQFLSDFFADEA